MKACVPMPATPMRDRGASWTSADGYRGRRDRREFRPTVRRCIISIWWCPTPGMAWIRATVERIFEPYYTTKPRAKAPAWGCPSSTVIVEGAWRIHPRVQRGRRRQPRFHVYLHCSAGPCPSPVLSNGAPFRAARGGFCLWMTRSLWPIWGASCRGRLGYPGHQPDLQPGGHPSFEADPQSFDAVVTDPDHAGMTGLELCEARAPHPARYADQFFSARGSATRSPPSWLPARVPGGSC